MSSFLVLRGHLAAGDDATVRLAVADAASARALRALAAGAPGLHFPARPFPVPDEPDAGGVYCVVAAEVPARYPFWAERARALHGAPAALEVRALRWAAPRRDGRGLARGLKLEVADLCECDAAGAPARRATE
jgi:hypothetical protein